MDNLISGGERASMQCMSHIYFCVGPCRLLPSTVVESVEVEVGVGGRLYALVRVWPVVFVSFRQGGAEIMQGHGTAMWEH